VQFFKDIAAAYNKHAIFTETGWRSVQYAYTAAGDWSTPGVQDLQEQANDYEAFFQVFGNRTDGWFDGAFFWNWEPSSNPTQYPWYPTGYTFQGKPALSIIEQWFQ
jgi:hypothetical protein